MSIYSGVAVSLSCTDSSAGSSEDASEPGSPCAAQTFIEEEQQSYQKKSHLNNNYHKMKMPTQTTMLSTSTNAVATTTGAMKNATTTMNKMNNVNNTAKIKLQQQQQQIMNAANKQQQQQQQNKARGQQLPALQLPWNTTAGVTISVAKSTTTTANAKKRNFSITTTTTNNAESVLGVKKARNTTSVTTTGATTTTPTTTTSAIADISSKRLKAAAMEESQTKITGYFKSQMKAATPTPIIYDKMQQSNANNNSTTPTTTTTANQLTITTSTTAATAASLNKFFNIITQLKEGRGQQQQQQQQPDIIDLKETEKKNINAMSISNNMNKIIPVPALKKIERSKPTKIAQVAPNLRKMPTNSTATTTTNGYCHTSTAAATAATTNKSPPKKHVAIAPRTPEMKQQQQQKQLQQQQQHIAAAAAAATNNNKQTTTTNNNNNNIVKQQQQQHKQTTTTTNNVTATPTFYQLPMQLPNLVQLPQLLATNGANIMQINNIAAAAAAAKAASAATANPTAQAAAAAQAAQVAQAAQYFLNGTVFKLQQFTAATATTTTNATTANNPFNIMSANDLQELILKQQQQQQKNSVEATASFQEMFQQQIAAAFATQQQQQMQRLGATQQPVIMATPAGLLFNAASLPAMLAQAAAAMAVNTGAQQQQQQLKQQPLPALQPIQPATLPALSSIFAPANTQQQQQNEVVNELQQFQQQQLAAQLALVQTQQQQQQQQFVNNSQPPPLSAVTNKNLAPLAAITPVPVAATQTAKLAIVKGTPTVQYPALNSQPPPLVTISNVKSRTTASVSATTTTAATTTTLKANTLPKNYQKRVAPTGNCKLSGKLNGNTGKFIATPTTPPPLVPATSCSSSTALKMPTPPLVSLPTPSLVAISSNKPNNTTTSQMSSVDLFDFVKNSKGAISITLSNNNNTSKSNNNNNNNISCFALSTEKVKDVSEEVKDEPMEFASQESNESDDIKNEDTNNECSLSGYSSHSVSSAADLSLEGSIPACSPSDGASNQDMLSEMVTSAESAAEVTNDKTIVPAELEYEHELATTRKRVVTTPESGIGGSLSNCESNSSTGSGSGMSSTSVQCASLVANFSTDSSNSSSPTPMTTETNDSSNTPSPISQIDTSNDITNNTNSSTENNYSCLSLFNTSNCSFSNLSALITNVDDSQQSSNKCAISPILSQPKTIRFPAAKRQAARRHDGVCYWDKCNKKHESSSKLLDHMQTQHVNTQTGPFSCLWVGCKVYNKESCSRRWLERHVLSHGGSKQFKCIVEGCGLRFGSQLALHKHANNHFTATENKESTNKRTSDPPVPKQLRKNGKKLRYRRQPFSARMFDFFDTGIMEGLQHRLSQISILTNGTNSITFQGQCMMRRKSFAGVKECYVQWSPREIISDEWLPESDSPYVKTIDIRRMKPAEKTRVESLLMTAYKLPYFPNLFERIIAHKYEQKNSNIKCNSSDYNDTEAADDEEIVVVVVPEDDEDDEEEEECTDDSTTMTSTISTTTTTSKSLEQLLTSFGKINILQHKKHPRKPQRTSKYNNNNNSKSILL